MRSQVLVGALVTALGCSGPTTVFHCEADLQCVKAGEQGICVDPPSGLCAFRASDCGSGYRYDNSAGSRAGNCVGQVADGADGSVTDLTMADSNPGALVWDSKLVPGALTLNAIWGSDPRLVLVVGLSGFVARSQDRGVSWQAVGAVAGRPNLLGVWGTSGGNIYAVGNRAIYRSIDAGDSWQAVTTYDQTGEYMGIWGSSPNDVWVVGTGGRVQHATNGTTFSTVSLPGTPATLHGVWGTSATNIYIAGGPGYHTTDGGVQWSTLQPMGDSSTRCVVGFGVEDVWLCGSNALYRSVNNGVSWQTPAALSFAVSKQPATIYGLAFDDLYFTLTDSQAGAPLLLHTTNQGASAPNVDTSPAPLTNWPAIWASGPRDIYLLAGDHVVHGH